MAFQDELKPGSYMTTKLLKYVLLSFFTGTIGYYVGVLRQDPDELVGSSGVPSLDHYFTPKSFSEIETTKELLDAISQRFLSEVQAERIGALTRNPSLGVSAYSQQDMVFTAIRRLENGIKEFKGTPPEHQLAEALLLTLEKARLWSRWTDVYLGMAYQHPMEQRVGYLAEQAVRIGEAAGRVQEVLAALKYVTGIPLGFSTKHEIEAALYEFTGQQYTGPMPGPISGGESEDFHPFPPGS